MADIKQKELYKKINLKRLQNDLEDYRVHAKEKENNEYQTAVEYIQEIINNFDEEEAIEILDRVAWMVRRETTKSAYDNVK